MRTTVTLDDDALHLVRRLMQREDLTFKEAVNRAIRMGLGSSRRTQRFRQRTYAMGYNPAVPYDRALQVAGQLEDQELLRKLAAGK